MSFASLGLSESILRAVSERGYTDPTPIQAQAIPAVLSGGDLLAGAQTGTGKTAGFTLPILQRLSTTEPRKAGAIRALVLTPTRELAAQVEESVREYGKHTDISSMVMFGGVSINPQITQLKKRVDVLVATPGRLLDHVQQKTLDLSNVEILVLDEADRMLDMGFIRDIKKVLALLPKQRQNLLFSATFSDEIKALADGLLNNPALIEVARRNQTTELVEQKAMLVEQRAKRHLLAHLIKEHAWFQVLVFTRTKHGANRLAEQLTKGGIPSLAIHGNKSQNARTRALAEFKSGELQVLVATDIAARGLDIVELPHVVNFELPNVPEDYVHRIGRTGRAGATGEALSLVAPDEAKYLADIEKLTKKQLTRVTPPAFELPPVSADDSMAREPRQPRNGGRREGGGQRGAGQRTEGGRGDGQRQGQRREGQGQGQRDGAPRTGGQRRPRPEGLSARDVGEVVSAGGVMPEARAAGGRGDGQRQGRNRNEGSRDGAARTGNARGDGARNNGGRGRQDGQPGSQPRARSAGNGGGNSGNGPRRQGASQPQRAGGGNRQGQGNNRPRYPRDENGDVNGNVILPSQVEKEVDGNRAPSKQGGIRNALSRGIKALRGMA
ncbi:DEAD/DEAH box helicase [Uliginosibacterium sp. H3]|uniref:ATP-dependent RNA helicase RhlE n=1 Tax=Uliginosibacterium silvisoli TaxID=3114758 RepID=A0ABU6JYF5_9RHOO|nr:DEAD/DEAH box helicase [Uliginosibacterium sp. H3]